MKAAVGALRTVPAAPRRGGALGRALRRPGARLALALLAVWLVAALAGPALFGAPSAGTSDLLGPVVTGARDSGLLVLVVLALAIPGGWLAGVLTGAGGRGRDSLLSRILETVGFWPPVVLFPLLVAAIELPRPLLLGLVLALVEGSRVARLVRGEVLRHRIAPYVAAARALGAARFDVFRRHVLPHTLGPLLVAASFAGATTIATDTALAYLGLGGRPATSWGGLIGGSLTGGRGAAALAAAVIATAAFWLLAESLEAELDPRPSHGPR